MKVTRLHCTHCHTTIENQFEFSKFAALSKEQLHFAEIFITCRGNIKEVEKELGISYPTVRGKLTEIISALGYEQEKKTVAADKSKVIQMLENGEISSEDAIKLLKEE
ncbi:hypothetical protein JCM9152_1338 [Halalkalibacter hemicellulosilyticusJCM 9152]|uniref:DUF2089 domain-containing protein n=2 Tax=Halalkalibacter TaxID=2893056 RepID=W4QE69_9BACI|nr:hypothetical protein JCM9152_1338 [Halalkalibacter hemicellulosilyticusJCM 9152]